MKLVVFPYLPKFDFPSNYLSRLPTQSLYFALGHDPASFIGNIWENCDDHVVSFPHRTTLIFSQKLVKALTSLLFATKLLLGDSTRVQADELGSVPSMQMEHSR